MKIHEYQGKAILREYAVPVPNGDVADSPAQARAIAQRLGGKVVVKAQIHAGGRGKGGGVKLADDPAGAEAAADFPDRHARSQCAHRSPRAVRSRALGCEDSGQRPVRAEIPQRQPGPEPSPGGAIAPRGARDR